MGTPTVNEDYTCKLCRVYMHDLLDSPPCKPKDRVNYSKRLRPLLPELVDTFTGFIQDIGAHLPLPKDSDEYDIIDICSEFGLLEQIEVCLDMLSEKGGFHNKEFRDWLLEKFIIVVKDLHQIHNDHIMTPFLYKIRKIKCLVDTVGTVKYQSIDHPLEGGQSTSMILGHQSSYQTPTPRGGQSLVLSGIDLEDEIDSLKAKILPVKNTIADADVKGLRIKVPTEYH